MAGPDSAVTVANDLITDASTANITDASTVNMVAKILVINDSPDFLEFMREFLSEEGGFEVATLDQSEGVIEQVTATPPSLIVLDIVFRHGRSGLEVAELLSATADTANIPVLFCTALTEREIPADQRARIAERDQRLIFKPFDVDDLLFHIEELLAR